MIATKNPTGDTSPGATMSAARAGELREALNRSLRGKADVIEHVLACLLARGHLLLEDLPGLGKTTLAKAIADAVGGRFSRVQCTPDLLPGDITGFSVFNQKSREFDFLPGPVFSDVMLADEINRTTPRTQSALLEAMAERQVTVDNVRRRLSQTFFVIATQNPVEHHGTYPLPEAQLDRFMFLIRIGYPTEAQELEIVRRTTGRSRPEPNRVLSAEDCTALQEIVREMPVPDHVISYALRIVRATRGSDASAPSMVKDYLSWGAGPRASQFLVLAAKAKALLEGDQHVMVHHIRSVALPVLRHRIVTNFNAQADRVTSDDVIASLLESVPVESTDPVTAKGLDRTMPVQ